MNSNSTMIKRVNINLAALAALADTALTTEVKKEFNIDLMPAGVKEALLELKAEKAKSTARDAAKEIMDLLDAKEAVKIQAVLAIRNARRLIDEQKAILDAINVAEKYGNETSNYLPLCKAIGLPVPYGFASQDLFTIPVLHKQVKIVKKTAA